MPASRPQSTSVSIRSPIIAVVSECAPIRVQRGAHHHRVRLADEVRLDAGRLGDQRGDRARGGQRALGGRAGRVRVGGDEPGAVVDQPDRLGDRLEAVACGSRRARRSPARSRSGCSPTSCSAVVRPASPITYARAARALVGQELRGGQRRRPDRLLGHVEADAGQPGVQVARGVDRVVGEHEERLAGARAAA